MASQHVSTDLFPERYLAPADPAAELAPAKESGRPIILLILGPLGHEAIRFLCDDYQLPAEERRVRWIHSLSSGIEWYRVESLQEYLCGIPFTNGKGAYSYYLGLHVLYSFLYFNRETARLQANRAAKRWDVFSTVDPRGSKVGILGYGDIGRATAKILQPLGVRVTGVRRREPTDTVDEFGVTILSGDEAMLRVIEESDVVVNILPATALTNGFFNASIFAKMKPNALYINVGRGSTQNEADLATALKDGVIAGASLDVFETEPLPQNSPLWEVSDRKLLCSPHNACITENSFKEAVELFRERAEKYLTTGQVEGYMPDVTSGY